LSVCSTLNRRFGLKKLIRVEVFLLLSLFSTCMAVGCGTAKAPDAQQKQGLAASPGAASVAILAKADASDGNVDNVISKCVSCRLGMDGSPEHAVNYGGYAVHLCSEDCKKAFSADPEKALQALSFPK
jgi:YHS domain-containing protein